MTPTLDQLQEARVVLGRPGLAGTGITQGEKGDIGARLTSLEGRGLSDLISGEPVDGNIPVYDEDADAWVPGGATGYLAQVIEAGKPSTAVNDVQQLATAVGITVAENGPGSALIIPVYGTQANTIAQGNHLHPVVAPQRFALANPGSAPNLTSGSRDLVTANIGPFAVDVPTRVTVRGYVYAEGVVDVVNADVFLEIDGNRATTSDIPMAEPIRWEQGVNAVVPWEHSLVITRAASGTTSQTAENRQVKLGVIWRSWGQLRIIAAWMVVDRLAYR
jgi:hypothetical protein